MIFRDKIYTYTLERGYTYAGPPPVSGSAYSSAWINISPAGLITIAKGYAWDGCSPKVILFNALLIGTWDGPIRNGFPVCYYPSLVHDALCQFASTRKFPYTFLQIDDIFLKMLEEVGWVNARGYYRAVRIWHRLSLRGT